ncbi:CTP synthase [Bifidobacterium saguinibicoloris]|uniref:CTP synthase n=1 Tax=Bifidobacterium saguinibicoloris TaxID=2834433 RepID=UPI001F1EEC63|nr:CTP synthase [Bifidobacterium saguinibicoloris]
MVRHHAVDALFAEARREKRCVVAPTDTEFKAIQRRVCSGGIVKPFRGLYAQTDYWNALDRYEQVRHVVRALSRCHPDWVFCGPTAAIMHRLDCSYRLSCPLWIAVAPGTHYRNSGQLTRHVISNPEIAEVEGVKVTGLLRTLFDCAAALSLRYSLAPIDSSLRANSVDKDVLLAYPSSVKYSRRRRTVMRAFTLSDARSENGGESSARGMLHEMGYPPDDIQTEFPCLDHPGRRHRVDFLWKKQDGTCVVMEFDGVRKYVDPNMTSGRSIREVVDGERRRQQCLERQRVSVIRMYANELDSPARILRDLESLGVRRVP